MSGDPAAQPLAGGLYFVATPIGNARDITLRALDILRTADVLAAEDTRSLRHLMDIHGIPVGGRPVLAYHDHNGPQMRPKLLAHLAEGRSVAYASEAGMPLVADPGYVLGKAAAEAGFGVTVAPGASAALAALAVSGLPSDRFLFAGFAPSAAGARGTFLRDLAGIEATIILFESPKRLAALLAAASDAFGPDRSAAVCRELTKKFEEVRRGSLSELAGHYSEQTPRGEIVVCIGKGQLAADPAQIEAALTEALERLKLKDAATEIADRFGVPRRDIYQLGLSLRQDD